MKKLALGLVIVVSAGAGGALVAYRSITAGSDDGHLLKLVIRPGWTASRIAQELEEQGVIGSAWAFRLFLKVTGGEAKLVAGEYELVTDMPFSDLAATLEEGPEVKFVKLTVPEGFNLEQTSLQVERQTHIRAEDFRAAATSSTVKPSIPLPETQSLEGFLYPKTYHVIEMETAADIVRRMVGQFEKETKQVPWQDAAGLGLSPYEAIVVAAMIEEETRVDDERALVSAVIHNRLRRGMKLEIDATVQYAVKKYSGEPLTESDLVIDSPYNTRKFAGLPPGPISTPRVESILAALRPARSEALYYVLTSDCRHHFFTPNYNEFLQAKAGRGSC